MPSTTVHIPDKLLSEIDQFTKEKEISRNRFIIQACQEALNTISGEWPEGFFDTNFSRKDLKILREGVEEMEGAIIQKRKSRKVAKL
jgi:hypothetical protein